MAQPKITAGQINKLNLDADTVDGINGINISQTGHNHDTRYYTESELNNGKLDTRYYTEGEVDALVNNSGGGFNGGLGYMPAAVYTIPVGTLYKVPLAMEYDTGGFWNASNPTRLTIPTGVTRIMIKAFAVWTSNGSAGSWGGHTTLLIFKNFGQSYLGNVWNRQAVTFPNTTQQAISPAINVIAGDYFELALIHDWSVAMAIFGGNGTGTFLSIEAV